LIVKLSREEVAARFMAPPDRQILDSLVRQNLITPWQAQWGSRLPIADDVTIEADSAGHTDNRPLSSLFEVIDAVRREKQDEHSYEDPIRIGAAGGIGSPTGALAAFAMGAAYVVTGSINQACVESGTSDHVKRTLAEVSMSDVVMAPSADMFEMGTKVQVIKKNTMFPMNAQKLYDVYMNYKSIDEFPESFRVRLEKTYFRSSIQEVWADVCDYFKNEPKRIANAERNPKLKMALLFRWYLGRSSNWAVEGVEDRKMDMQIWCGQSMGAFNNWARGSELEAPENRKVAVVAARIMDGAARLANRNLLLSSGVNISDIPPDFDGRSVNNRE
jgi:PfaD family protein